MISFCKVKGIRRKLRLLLKQIATMVGPCNYFTKTLTHPAATHSYPLGDTLGVMDMAPRSIFNQVSDPVGIVLLFVSLLAIS